MNLNSLCVGNDRYGPDCVVHVPACPAEGNWLLVCNGHPDYGAQYVAPGDEIPAGWEAVFIPVARYANQREAGQGLATQAARR